MPENFPESNSLLLGALQANAAGGLDGDAVNAARCNDLTVIFTMAVAAGNTAGDQATVAVKAAEDNAGTNVETLSFDEYYIQKAATLAAAGSPVGCWERVDLTTAVTSFQTAAADGTKQIRLAIPIRTRSLPQGKNWVSGHVTALTNARVIGIEYVRHLNDYSPNPNEAMY